MSWGGAREGAGRKRSYTAQEIAECVRLYSEGALLKHLAEMYGRHRVVINRWIREAGAKRGHKFRGKWLLVQK